MPPRAPARGRAPPATATRVEPKISRRRAMRGMRVRLAAVAVLALLLETLAARAGQRRVDVGAIDGFHFNPVPATLNNGDHVTWVWVSGQHTVTNGSDP